jgi:hypothetical protein
MGVFYYFHDVFVIFKSKSCGRVFLTPQRVGDAHTIKEVRMTFLGDQIWPSAV